MMTSPDRPPGLGRPFVSVAYNSRISRASRCWNGYRLMFPPPPPWKEVKGLCPEIRLLWHHRNNLSVDANGVIWRKRSSQGSQLQLLVPRPARESLFQAYHASLFGGHFVWRNRTLARLSYRFYWSGMSDDVKDWLRQCTTCIKRKSPTGRHHPLGNIPTGHRWDRITMDILDVCDPTPDGYRYILVIADYFSK